MLQTESIFHSPFSVLSSSLRVFSIFLLVSYQSVEDIWVLSPLQPTQFKRNHPLIPPRKRICLLGVFSPHKIWLPKLFINFILLKDITSVCDGEFVLGVSKNFDVSNEGFVKSDSVFCQTTWYKPGCTGEIDERLESWVLCCTFINPKPRECYQTLCLTRKVSLVG